MNQIIKSLLDLDRYKLTMSQFIFYKYPNLKVEYSFTNRTKDDEARELLISLIPYINRELDAVGRLRFGFSELNYMYNTGIFKEDYLNFLSQIKFDEIPVAKVSKIDGKDQLEIVYRGRWSVMTLWETYCLSIVSELYSRAIAIKRYSKENKLSDDKVFELMSKALYGDEEVLNTINQPFYEEAMRRLNQKIDLYKHHPIIKVFEFGTRRRFDAKLQEMVVLKMAESFHKPQFIGTSQFMGTSNEYLAFKHNLKAGGTSAHEIDMGIAAYHDKDELSMIESFWDWRRKWFDFYGYDLSVCLTDTFGSEWFFKNCPPDIAEKYSFREDSAINLFEYTDKVLDLYRKYNIAPNEKVIVHSNGLTALKVINIANYKQGEINKVYGQGTDLSCDVGLDYKHLSIVIKLSRVLVDGEWVGTVKLSDNLAKAIGEPKQIERYKKLFGYVNELSETQIY